MDYKRFVSRPTEELSSRVNRKTGSWTGDSSLSMDVTDYDFRLLNVAIHFSAPVTNDATVTIDSTDGVNYDTTLVTFRNTSGASHNLGSFGVGDEYEAGTIIKVSCDAGAATAYCTIRFKLT